MYYKKTAVPYGKTDNSKDVGISKEKTAELRAEAEKEAKGDKDKADRLFEEKYSDLKTDLEKIKRDIVHYDNKMESFSDIPFKYKSGHSYYQGAKLEYDSAIRKYEELGGAVGEDCFVQKGVSRLEALAGRMDVYSSNIFNTVIVEAFAEHKDKGNFAGIYKGEDGSYDSYSRINKGLSHFGDFFGGTVGQVFKAAALGIDKISGLFRDNDAASKDKDKESTAESRTDNIEKNNAEADKDAQADEPEGDISADEKENDSTPENDAADVSDADGTTSDEDMPENDIIEPALNDSAEEKDDISDKTEEQEKDEVNTPDSSETEIIENTHGNDDDSRENIESRADADDRKDDTLPEDAIASEQISDKTDGDEELVENPNTDNENPDDINTNDTDKTASGAEYDEEDKISDSDSDEDEVFIEIEDPAFLEEETDEEYFDDMVNLDEGMEIHETADDPVSLEDVDISSDNDRREYISEKNDNAKIDAAVSEEYGESASSMDIADELSEDVIRCLSGEDDNETVLNSISDIIADERLAPDDLIDSLSDAIINSMDDGFPEGTDEMIQEVANAMDGAPVDNVSNILDELAEKGIDYDALVSLEDGIADSFESAVFENDASGLYEGFIFDDTGVHDFAAGDDFFFPDSISDLETGLLNDIENMELPNDFEQEFRYDDFETAQADAVDYEYDSQVDSSFADSCDSSSFNDSDYFFNQQQDLPSADDFAEYDQFQQNDIDVSQQNDFEVSDNISNDTDFSTGGVDLE